MMATEREASCAERIAGQLRGRLDAFTELGEREGSDDDDAREAASEEHYEYPLAVSVRRVVRVELSTGGPADWLEVFQDLTEPSWSEPERIVYHFADWFDHAEVTLEGTDFQTAWTFCGPFLETLDS